MQEEVDVMLQTFGSGHRLTSPGTSSSGDDLVLNNQAGLLSVLFSIHRCLATRWYTRVTATSMSMRWPETSRKFTLTYSLLGDWVTLEFGGGRPELIACKRP